MCVFVSVDVRPCPGGSVIVSVEGGGRGREEGREGRVGARDGGRKGGWRGVGREGGKGEGGSGGGRGRLEWVCGMCGQVKWAASGCMCLCMCVHLRRCEWTSVANLFICTAFRCSSKIVN
jgi:hypothetical protein